MTQDRQLHPRMWSSGLGKKDSPLVFSQLQLPGLLPGVTVLAWTCSAGHTAPSSREDSPTLPLGLSLLLSPGRVLPRLPQALTSSRARISECRRPTPHPSFAHVCFTHLVLHNEGQFVVNT